MRPYDPDLLRWARHVDHLRAVAAIVLVLLLSLSGCATTDPQSINGMTANAGWTQAGQANNAVFFRQGDPSAACGKPAQGCEQHFPGYSVITTREHWCTVPAGLIGHELGHVCGKVHP